MKRIQTIFSSCIGNIIEWYDFGLFTIFSAIFSKLFFPSGNPHLGFIATITIFSIGFICRPIGGLIFGYVGDRYGRAITLRYSILIIAIPTFLIGLIPTYQQIGIFAPLLLLVIRMLQGISIGGEYSGNIIYLAESAPTKRRALITTLASMGSNFGILLAALIGMLSTFLFNQAALEQYGWRIPYILSGFISFFIYYHRLKLNETSTYKNLKTKKHIASNPISSMFKKDYKHLLVTFGLVCMGTTFYFFLFTYIPMHLLQISNLNTANISRIMSGLIIVMIISAPLAAMLCDKLGRRKMLLFNAALISLIIIPGFYLLHSNSITLILSILTLFTIASAFEQSTTPISIVENFPARTRYTGVSFAYNFGNGFMGGTVPIICQWLLCFTNFFLAPAVYITLCACITGISVYLYIYDHNINL